MKLYIVFAQRKESRPGEYAPEALFIVSEYDYEENPAWIKDRLAEARADEEYIGADIFLVDLGNQAEKTIRSYFLDHPQLKGSLQTEAVQ